MKILRCQPVSVEIGTLDAAIRLPMASRLSIGMKTICDACGKSITDKNFIGGFKAGQANLKLHESCAAEQGVVVTL